MRIGIMKSKLRPVCVARKEVLLLEHIKQRVSDRYDKWNSVDAVVDILDEIISPALLDSQISKSHFKVIKIYFDYAIKRRSNSKPNGRRIEDKKVLDLLDRISDRLVTIAMNDDLPEFGSQERIAVMIGDGSYYNRSTSPLRNFYIEVLAINSLGVVSQNKSMYTPDRNDFSIEAVINMLAYGLYRSTTKAFSKRDYEFMRDLWIKYKDHPRIPNIIKNKMGRVYTFGSPLIDSYNWKNEMKVLTKEIIDTIAGSGMDEVNLKIAYLQGLAIHRGGKFKVICGIKNDEGPVIYTRYIDKGTGYSVYRTQSIRRVNPFTVLHEDDMVYPTHFIEKWLIEKFGQYYQELDESGAL